MERQATQPAAVPTGRKRRRVCAKKKNGDQEAQDLDTQATQPPTSELVVALKALPRAEEPTPPQTVNELMDCTLKEYEEECVGKTSTSIAPYPGSGSMERHRLLCPGIKWPKPNEK